jgi:hypothetical protein
VWTTSISVFEVFFGIDVLPTGKRQAALRGAFEETLNNELDGRILTFDTASAIEAAVTRNLHSNSQVWASR